MRRELRKGSLVDLLDAEPALVDLADADLIQAWEDNDQQLRHNGNCEDHDTVQQRQREIEAEWEKRYPGIPISDPEPPALTASDIMAETGISRSAANHRLRLGLPRDLLLHPGKLPRGEYNLPESERARKGKVIRKYHLYKIAEAATDLFCSKDPTADKLIRLRDALEASGVDLMAEAIGEVDAEGEAFNAYWHRQALSMGMIDEEL